MYADCGLVEFTKPAGAKLGTRSSLPTQNQLSKWMKKAAKEKAAKAPTRPAANSPYSAGGYVEVSNHFPSVLFGLGLLSNTLSI